jgi:hypothetical protein
VLVAAAATDGTVAAVERGRLNALLSSMALFREVPSEHLQRVVDNNRERVTHTAEDELLPTGSAVIPGNLRASLYSRAVSLYSSMARSGEREKRFGNRLQMARD